MDIKQLCESAATWKGIISSQWRSKGSSQQLCESAILAADSQDFRRCSPGLHPDYNSWVTLVKTSQLDYTQIPDL